LDSSNLRGVGFYYPAQAGVAVYECGNSGLLVAARIVDDADPPAVSDTSSS
jgi:hypothetical protein